MDLYFEAKKVSVISVIPSTTIGEIKSLIKNWLLAQGIVNYKVSLIFNNGTKLSPAVFNTQIYDSSNFQSQANLISGSQLHINLPKKMIGTTKAVKNNSDFIRYEGTNYYLWTKGDNSVYYDESSHRILISMNALYENWRGDTNPALFRQPERDTGLMIIRDIDDFLDGIIYPVFIDHHDDAGENVIIDLKEIQEASTKGIETLKRVINKFVVHL